MARPRRSFVGCVFGDWTVLSDTLVKGRQGCVCKCICGAVRDIDLGNLRFGRSGNCGCTRKRTITHGHTVGGYSTSTYKSWQHMLERCNDLNGKNYKYYGGRGIKVCGRWLSFENFLADMGEKPDGLTIERKDNDGDYHPDNCVWATRTEQNRNKRNNVKFHVVEEIRRLRGIMHQRDIAAKFGVSPSTVTRIQLRQVWD